MPKRASEARRCFHKLLYMKTGAKSISIFILRYRHRVAAAAAAASSSMLSYIVRFILSRPSVKFDGKAGTETVQTNCSETRWKLVKIAKSDENWVSWEMLYWIWWERERERISISRNLPVYTRDSVWAIRLVGIFHKLYFQIDPPILFTPRFNYKKRIKAKCNYSALSYRKVTSYPCKRRRGVVVWVISRSLLKLPQALIANFTGTLKCHYLSDNTLVISLYCQQSRAVY